MKVLKSGGGGIFVFEKQEKGSNAKKKKKIISQQREIDSNVKNKAPFPLPNFCCSTYGLSALVWWVDVITRVA